MSRKMVVKHEIINMNGHIMTKSSLTDKTFVQALNDKYVNQEEFDNQFTLPKDKSISTDITFVGFGRVSNIQKQLKRLISIDLSNHAIEAAGDIGNLHGTLNQVRVLNLADNQLTWDEVIKILSCLPNLREIILSGNKLDSNVDNLPKQLHKKLDSLTLGRVYINWVQLVDILSKIWISIEQLDLFDNNLRVEDLCLCQPLEYISFTSHIRALMLGQNKLPKLDWLTTIGPVENLVELDVSRCNLESIKFDLGTLNTLKNLRTVNISSNDIEDWPSISSLDRLENLISLICHDNPVFIKEKFARSFTIARIGRIKVLNRQEITKGQRRDSEIFYLRKVYPEYEEFKDGKTTNFAYLHPRYDELIEIHGLPEGLNKRETVDKYITVDLCFDDQKVTKKLPCDMRVSNLQMLCKRLFKLKPFSNIEIICCEPQESESGISYPLDKEATLGFFSVKNNSKLQIKIED